MLRGNSRGKVIPPKLPKAQTLDIQQLPIFHQFKKVMNSQQRKFKVVHIHCDELQKSVQNLENLVLDFDQKIQQYMETKGIEQIHSLKQKQNTFIIQELNMKIKKLSRKQIELHDQIKRLKSDNVSLQEQVSSNERKSKVIDNQLQNELVAELKQKNLKIVELNQKVQYLNDQIANMSKNAHKVSSFPPLDPSKKKASTVAEYEELANRLKDIESLMDLQTQQYKEKIQSLERKYATVQQQKQKSESKWSSVIYELQLKLKQQKTMCKELEQANNSLLAKSSENQIMLHQQIMNLKKNINEEKKIVKNLKKEYHSGLNDISKMVIDKAILFNSSKVEEQCHQLAKQIVKIQKRSTNSSKQLHQAQIKQLNQQIEKKNKQINELQEKIKNQRSSAMFTTSNQNVNSSFNKSSDKGQISQEKYRSKFENMKKDLKIKQNRIYEMQEELDKQFNQSTQKILKLQQQFLIKNNECRRKEQMLIEAQQQVKSLTQKLQMGDKFKEQLRQQYHSNKQAIQASWREKYSKMQQAAHTYRNNLKEAEARQQQLTGKLNKLKAKYDKIDHQHTETLKSKNEKIDQLTKKNHSLLIQNRVNKEKMAFEIQIIKAEQTDSQQGGSTMTTPNKDLIDQIQMERDRILQDYEVKKQQAVNLDYDKKVLLKKVSTIEEILEEQRNHKNKIQNKIQSYKAQIQNLRKQLKSRIQINEKQHQSSFVQLKKQYQRVSQALKSLQKSYEKKKKEYEEAVKSRDKYKTQATSYKSQADKNNNKLQQVQYQLKGKNDEKQSIVIQYKCKLSQKEVKIKELLKIIEYRKINPDESYLKESIRQNDSPLQPLIQKQTKQEGVNTDIYEQKKQEKIIMTPTKVPTPKQSQSSKKNEDIFKENLFSIQGHEINNLQDNFEICDEGDMNYNQNQVNWRIKEFFNCFRSEIEKLFNGQDPSIQIIKIIPAQLEEDYNEFVAYLKEKISELHHQNQISFINVIIGNQPEISETSLDLPQIISKGQSEEKWKLILMQKQAVINSLIAQKTEQQHTINQLTLQKQEIQEENENRFMNQCNIYKKEIKEHKKTLDILEMNYQSMKNLMKNIMEIWVSQDDMQDDLRDNMELYGKVAKLSDKERSRLNYYIMKYKQIKKIE